MAEVPLIHIWFMKQTSTDISAHKLCLGQYRYEVLQVFFLHLHILKFRIFRCDLWWLIFLPVCFPYKETILKRMAWFRVVSLKLLTNEGRARRKPSHVTSLRGTPPICFWLVRLSQGSCAGVGSSSRFEAGFGNGWPEVPLAVGRFLQSPGFHPTSEFTCRAVSEPSFSSQLCFRGLLGPDKVQELVQ